MEGGEPQQEEEWCGIGEAKGCVTRGTPPRRKRVRRVAAGSELGSRKEKGTRRADR